MSNLKQVILAFLWHVTKYALEYATAILLYRFVVPNFSCR